MADLRIASQVVCCIGAALCGPAVSCTVTPWTQITAQVVPLPEPEVVSVLLARPQSMRWVQPSLFEVVS